VALNGTLVEAKMLTSHDGASAKFSTSLDETDYSSLKVNG
jgi:hypothetical protein